MYIGLCVKYPFFCLILTVKLDNFQHFVKTLKYQISWKSVQWEPNYSMRTDEYDEANNRLL